MRVLDVLRYTLGADEGGAAVTALQFHVETLCVLFEGRSLQERARAVLKRNETTVEVKFTLQFFKGHLYFPASSNNRAPTYCFFSFHICYQIIRTWHL